MYSNFNNLIINTNFLSWIVNKIDNNILISAVIKNSFHFRLFFSRFIFSDLKIVFSFSNSSFFQNYKTITIHKSFLSPLRIVFTPKFHLFHAEEQ